MQDEDQRLVQPEAPQKTEEQRQLEARAQQILHRVKHIIIRRNTQFILEHQNDSLEQLSAYLKACMDDIGHPPARVEIIGGDYIEYRFGDWNKALRSIYSGKASAYLKNPPAFANRKIVRDLCEAEEAQILLADAALAGEVQA